VALHVQLEIGEHLCDRCFDVWTDQHDCRHLVVGLCLDCGVDRDLDRFGNCPWGHRQIVNRRLAHGVQTKEVVAIR
jgi:hypothetical protein